MGGAAADVNSGTTTIDGGKITTGSITAAQLQADYIEVGGAAADVNSGTTTIDGGKIAAESITADQIAGGTITADEIHAETISFDLLAVGVGTDNYIHNPHFDGDGSPHEFGNGFTLDAGFYRTGAQSVKFDPAGQAGSVYVNLNGNPGDPSLHHPVIAGRSYNFEVYCYVSSSDSAWNDVRLYWSWRDASGAQIASNYKTFHPGDLIADSWNQLHGQKVAPDGAVYVAFRVSVLNQGQAGILWFDDALGMTMVNAHSIEAESISADHIQAGAVTADKISVASLSAVNAETGDLDITGSLEMKSGAYLFGNDGGGVSWLFDDYGFLLSAHEDTQDIVWAIGLDNVGHSDDEIGFLAVHNFVDDDLISGYFGAELPSTGSYDDAEIRLFAVDGKVGGRQFNAMVYTDHSAGEAGFSLYSFKSSPVFHALYDGDLKLGFWGSTPVSQPTNISHPSGGSTVDSEARSAIEDILDLLSDLGLMAS